MYGTDLQPQRHYGDDVGKEGSAPDVVSAHQAAIHDDGLAEGPRYYYSRIEPTPHVGSEDQHCKHVHDAHPAQTR